MGNALLEVRNDKKQMCGKTEGQWRRKESIYEKIKTFLCRWHAFLAKVFAISSYIIISLEIDVK